LGLAGIASAADDNDAPKFRPFNGLFADMFTDDAKAQPPQPHKLQHYNPDYTVPNYSTAQPHPTATKPIGPMPPPPVAEAPSRLPQVADGITAPPRPTSTQPARRAVTSDNYSFNYNDGAAALPPPSAPTTELPAPTDRPLATAAPSSQSGAPMHERLKQFRQSPFADEPDTAGPTNPTPDTPQVAQQNVAPSQPVVQDANAGRNDVLPTPPSTPLVAAAPSYTHTEPQPQPQPQPQAQPQPQPMAALQQPSSTAASNGPAPQDPSVLIDHKSPQLSVETIGPRKIVVGKEAAYEVVLQNTGDQAAEEVAVTLGLPEWAEVAANSASSGEVVPAQADHSAQSDRATPCRWMLRRVEAHSKEKLVLKIIPRQSKPFELAVHWDFKQAPSQALIEVQEPKLAMRLDGPREVMFGKRELYQLKLANNGNGPAENVTLTLMPLNAGDNQPVTHKLGALAAGDQRTIEVELTARQSGKVTIRVEASGDGGAHVDLAETVVVHRGALRVEVDGPAVQYVGTPAAYTVVVSNTGDAAARNIKLTAKLPTGMKFVSGTAGAAPDSATDGGHVRWTLDRLDPGERKTLQMKCTLSVSGPNRVDFDSAADDELIASANTTTRVEAMADLRLELKEPDGPVPVGAEAVYELHIRNRGTKAAENVEVFSYFSRGVEPVSATGHRNRLNPGQVVFDIIPAVAPATELVLTVKAKAEAAGNHVFRAEVHCKSAGTRLVREEMTRFYQDNPTAQQTTAQQTPVQPAPQRAAPSKDDRYRDEQRTAERGAPLPLSQAPELAPTPAIKR
jgi:uncharacterized repeat protein (TIGR01451 family)